MFNLDLLDPVDTLDPVDLCYLLNFLKSFFYSNTQYLICMHCGKQDNKIFSLEPSFTPITFNLHSFTINLPSILLHPTFLLFLYIQPSFHPFTFNLPFLYIQPSTLLPLL